MSKDDKKGWVVKARRCSNDAQQHRLLNGELPSAKTELASPNGPRTLCHPPLSSTDRHGRLVDYNLHCQDHPHPSGWTRNRLIVGGFPSGNSRCCLRKWIQGVFYRKMESDGLGPHRLAPTSFRYAATPLSWAGGWWWQCVFVLIKTFFCLSFWGP